jgi:hypothetical protein
VKGIFRKRRSAAAAGKRGLFDGIGELVTPKYKKPTTAAGKAAVVGFLQVKPPTSDESGGLAAV